MAKKILLAGASGLIGSRLTTLLLAEGYQVAHLGRTARKGPVESFVWNLDTAEVDHSAFKDVYAVINLAGAGVADKQWTTERKREILDSRIKSTALIGEQLKKIEQSFPVYISASAIGYYGNRSSEEWCLEEDAAGDDFLACVVRDWEAAADQLKPWTSRVVKLRIGVVLSKQGGALSSMAAPIRWGVGAPLGTGIQYVSWIHIDDLCRMFLLAVENEKLTDAVNAVSPNPCTNISLTVAIARAMHRPLWMPKVPSFAMRLLLGEMADIVLKGCKCSANRISDLGFQFTHAELDEALQDLL